MQTSACATSPSRSPLKVACDLFGAVTYSAGFHFRAEYVDTLLKVLVHSTDDRLRYRVSKVLATPFRVSALGRLAVEEFAKGFAFTCLCTRLRF